MLTLLQPLRSSIFFGGLKKDKASSPFTRHIADAEKRLRSLEPDMVMRDARQENGTLYHELLAEGVTTDELEARLAENTDLRRAGLGYVRNEKGATPAIGLTYGGDHKAEEEYGIAHIAKSLRNGDYGPDDVLLYTKDGATVLAIRGERGDWSPNLDEDSSATRAAKIALDRFNNYYPGELSVQRYTLERLSVAQLRANLKDKVSPYLKTKTSSLKLI